MTLSHSAGLTGILVTNFALRHDVSAMPAVGWVRRFRNGALAMGARRAPPLFPPVVVARRRFGLNEIGLAHFKGRTPHCATNI